MSKDLVLCFFLISREFLNLRTGLTGGKGVKGLNGTQEIDWIKLKGFLSLTLTERLVWGDSGTGEVFSFLVYSSKKKSIIWG